MYIQKRIFVEYGDRKTKIFGPDVLNFPDFCEENGLTYDPTCQIDMSDSMSMALKEAWSRKQLFITGDYALKMDNWPTPAEDAQYNWLHMNLNPMREYWELPTVEIHKLRSRLVDLGVSMEGWPHD